MKPFLPALLALVALTAACGGNGEGAGTRPPATTGTATETRAQPPPAAATASQGWTATPIAEGIKPALALDGDGSPAVAYLREDVEHGFVAFASAAQDWQPEMVDEGYFYGPLDLAFDPEGRPHIVWHDHEGEEVDPRKGNLAYAVREGSSWQKEAARDQGHDGWDSTIAIGPDGVVRAAGIDPRQFGSEDGVEYYERGEDGWRAVSIGSGPIAYEFNVSLAVGPDGRPALTYYDDRAGDLVFAALEGQEWRLETVLSEGDAGKFSSLAFDAAGRPHISFFEQGSETAGRILYAVRDGGGWTIEEIGTLEQVLLGMNGARRNSSLALDAAGVPHVAFSDQGVLRYAVRSESGWKVEDVASAGERPLGQLVSLRLDEAGGPHLAFYEVTGTGPLAGLVIHLAKSS